MLEFLIEENDRHQIVDEGKIGSNSFIGGGGVSDRKMQVIAGMPRSELYVSLIDNQQQSFPSPEILTLSMAGKFQHQQQNQHQQQPSRHLQTNKQPPILFKQENEEIDDAIIPPNYRDERTNTGRDTAVVNDQMESYNSQHDEGIRKETSHDGKKSASNNRINKSNNDKVMLNRFISPEKQKYELSADSTNDSTHNHPGTPHSIATLRSSGESEENIVTHTRQLNAVNNTEMRSFSSSNQLNNNLKLSNKDEYNNNNDNVNSLNRNSNEKQMIKTNGANIAFTNDAIRNHLLRNIDEDNSEYDTDVEPRHQIPSPYNGMGGTRFNDSKTINDANWKTPSSMNTIRSNVVSNITTKVNPKKSIDGQSSTQSNLNVIKNRSKSPGIRHQREPLPPPDSSLNYSELAHPVLNSSKVRSDKNVFIADISFTIFRRFQYRYS